MVYLQSGDHKIIKKLFNAANDKILYEIKDYGLNCKKTNRIY